MRCCLLAWLGPENLNDFLELNWDSTITCKGIMVQAIQLIVYPMKSQFYLVTVLKGSEPLMIFISLSKKFGKFRSMLKSSGLSLGIFSCMQVCSLNTSDVFQSGSFGEFLFHVKFPALIKFISSAICSGVSRAEQRERSAAGAESERGCTVYGEF